MERLHEQAQMTSRHSSANIGMVSTCIRGFANCSSLPQRMMRWLFGRWRRTLLLSPAHQIAAAGRSLHAVCQSVLLPASVE